ncbi:MAG: SBBP repeat-containing protein, partial [Arenimonas sp.]
MNGVARKFNRGVQLFFFALLALTFSSNLLAAEPDNAKQSKMVANYGNIPMSFEANEGQSDRQVKFISRGAGYSLFLTPTEAVFQLRKPGVGVPKNATPGSSVVRMSFANANNSPRMIGEQTQSGVSNYFRGNASEQWKTDIAHFSHVRYQEIYQGIDVVFYGNQKQLEYDFVLSPSADVSQIKMNFAGAESLRVNEHGDLLLKVAGVELTHQAPISYQTIDNTKRAIHGRYRLLGEHSVGFDIDDYDENYELVIDPTVLYSSYLGGSADDYGNGIAVDAYGNAYICGVTYSTNFPTAFAYQAQPGQNTGDVFISKINFSGNALVYSTYLGGASHEQCNDIAIDTSGNVYVTGWTSSNDFPTVLPFQATIQGSDAFVSKLNAAGNGLVFSTYLGGSSSDNGTDIALDASRNVYIFGLTVSTNFPVLNAAQANNAGSWDAFISKFDATGSALVYSTYLGGSGYDSVNNTGGITVDNSGSAIVIGTTPSTDFPIVNAIRSSITGTTNIGDMYITKLAPDGASFVFSTYMGGSQYDYGNGIASSADGSIYFTGSTGSVDFLLPSGSTSTNHGSNDCYVGKLNSAGSVLLFGFYLGGGSAEECTGIRLDSSGNVYVTGNTYSANFPVQYSSHSPSGTSPDLFVSKFSNDGIDLMYSEVMPGNGQDIPLAIAVDTAGNAYLTGYTTSTDFISAGLPYSLQGNSDVIIVKIGNYPDGLARLSISDASVSEGNSGTRSLTYTVSLDRVSTEPVVYTAATNSGGTATVTTDYSGRTFVGEVIPAGSLTRTFNVPINGDTSLEANETVVVNLSNVRGAVLNDSQGIGTILNDDGPTLSINDVVISEGNSGTKLATFTVSLSQAALVPVSYTIATNSGGTATVTTDYTGKTLVGESIPAGQLSRTFTVTIKGDTTIEADETFFVTLSSAVGATIFDSRGVGTISNDDKPALSINNVSVLETNSGGTATVTTDYTGKTLIGETIPAGQTSRSFTVGVKGDTAVEANET